MTPKLGMESRFQRRSTYSIAKSRGGAAALLEVAAADDDAVFDAADEDMAADEDISAADEVEAAAAASLAESADVALLSTAAGYRLLQ